MIGSLVIHSMYKMRTDRKEYLIHRIRKRMHQLRKHAFRTSIPPTEGFGSDVETIYCYCEKNNTTRARRKQTFPFIHKNRSPSHLGFCRVLKVF
ncbi:unnamed protein product [Schistosoma mattheei]|uniref:Uncharacterized protein n=1 Tax=Schistosoma mattheei TaxID=31246 RepID=A0A183NEE3_9TREM|nr:unnamed protein product [Schistosoma mattheei]